MKNINIDREMELLIEAACGVGERPSDTGCTPKGGGASKPKFKAPKFKMPKIKMPKIINGSVKNAQLILRSYDLKLGNITYVPDMARNAVLKIFINGDSISENDLILKGSVIDMEVGNGLGNQVFEAPDLVNLDLEEARFTIIGSGLRLGNIIYQDSGFYFNKTIDEEGNDIYEKSYVDPGKVFKQSPSKSTRVRIGRRINLWIVSKPEDEVN